MLVKQGHFIKWKTFGVEAVIYSYYRSSTNRVFNIPISYSGGPEFMSQPEHRSIRLRFFVVFSFLPGKHQYKKIPGL
jgi:hypothetical protein